MIETLAKVLKILRDYHVKFLVEFLNYVIPGMKNKVDPYLYSMMMGQVAASADPEDVKDMRRWPESEWKKAIDKHIEVKKQQFIKESDFRSGEAVGLATATPPPAPPVPPGTAGGSGGGGDDPPYWLTPAEKAAWSQARTRAGELIRGLGDYVDEKTGDLVEEVWQGENIVTEAFAIGRQADIEIVREIVAEGVAGGLSSKEVARKLRNATEDFSRNWQRIAATELRGAYNDGAAIFAVQVYGKDEAKVARVPNAGHCEWCAGVFLDTSGNPIIFKVSDLVDNGTNAGRKRADWQPTLWPIHPNCRCDTQVVPPGYTFDNKWSLVKEGKRES